MQLSVLQKFNNPEILFGFGQIHSFLFELKIYMRDCFTVNLMYAVYFCPPNKMICSVDMETFATFKLEKVFALKSLSPRHCLRAQLPVLVAESLQNAALMQFQRIRPPLVATGKFCYKFQYAALNRTLLLV